MSAFAHLRGWLMEVCCIIYDTSQNFSLKTLQAKQENGLALYAKKCKNALSVINY